MALRFSAEESEAVATPNPPDEMTPEVIADQIIAKYGTPKSPAMLHAMLAYAAQMGKGVGAVAVTRVITDTFELARKRA